MLVSIENIKKDIEELSKFNATPSSGVTRFSYTEEHRKAKKYIVEEMNKAGAQKMITPVLHPLELWEETE